MSDKIHNSFVLASDHAGYDLKEQIKFYLENNNFKVKDLGPFNNDSVDYPDYGKVLGDFIASNKNIIGIMLESNLNPGSQSLNSDITDLEYGVSITDKCVGWEKTEEIILQANEQLST